MVLLNVSTAHLSHKSPNSKILSIIIGMNISRLLSSHTTLVYIKPPNILPMNFYMVVYLVSQSTHDLPTFHFPIQLIILINYKKHYVFSIKPQNKTLYNNNKSIKIVM